MIQINSLWWPDDVGDRWKHALDHVKSLDWTIARCGRRRTAIQAGGNVGLWPMRLAVDFDQVITFEPDVVSFDCLVKNVPQRVEVHDTALGARRGRCAIKHRGLGSHRVVDGESVSVVNLDSLSFIDVDLIQLDVEGYEWEVLKGAEQTIRRWKPVLHLELRDFTQKYGGSDEQVYSFLRSLGYEILGRRPGSDVVFKCVH